MVRTSRGLTDRHRKILAYLNERQTRGYPPSIREICEATDISSTSVVTYYLKQLEEWGYIQRDARFSRALRLAGTTDTNMIKIPIWGPIAAGVSIPVEAAKTFAGEDVYGVDIARSLLPPGEKGTDLFALKVQGDSMIDAMVSDGDIVILKQTQTADNGDMVAIWFPEENETTLKYFYKEKEGYRLQPANPTMQPFLFGKDKQLEIKGKVVLVIRSTGSLAV